VDIFSDTSRRIPSNQHSRVRHPPRCVVPFGSIADSLELFSGPASTGVFSKSVQETAYAMCVEVLRKFPDVSSVSLITPNIHHYPYPLEQFGLRNSNVVFQSTDCHTTASGRIETRVSRPAARM
jgi:hypothetical protein